MKTIHTLLWTSLLACLHPHPLSAGLDITASPVPLVPPRDHPSVLVHHATDDKGGNTSLRFVANRKVDENKYPTNGVTAFARAAREQPQRDRDLGQTFLTGDQRVRLDALFLRVGHADLAMLTNTPGARVAVQWFEVTGEPRLNDHGTPGFAGKFDRLTSPELDDYLEGETYTPLRVLEARLPEKLAKGDHLKLDFTGEDEFPLEPHRTYAFLLMFLTRAPLRGMTLANEYYGTYTPDPTNKLRGHGIRREGLPQFPDDWKARLAQPPGTLGFPDVCTFRDLHYAVTVRPAGARSERKTAAAFKQAPVDFNHPPRDYVTHRLHGWEVLVEKQLADEVPELASNALARVEKKLGEIAGLLPKASLSDLRQLRVFLMHGPRAKAGGRSNGLEYFRADAPRHHDWLDARMASSIIIFNAANYAKLTEHWALKSLMHEFGHAQHLEHWPEERADIYDTWQAAMKAGLYQIVREEDKATHHPNYAAQNHLEYFAELTTTSFCGNTYFPRDRAALKTYDPAGYALLEKLWGISDEEPKP